MIHLRLLALDRFARMTMELNGGYSEWQAQCPHLHIISQSQDFQHWSCCPYKFQKTWSTSFRFHINLGWLCNLRFDYQNKKLNLRMLHSFKGFHLCIKGTIMWYHDYQLRKKINLCMLLQSNKNILCKNQIRIQNIF